MKPPLGSGRLPALFRPLPFISIAAASIVVLSAGTEPDRRWAEILVDTFDEDHGQWLLENDNGEQSFVNGRLQLTAEEVATTGTDVSGLDGRSVEARVHLEANSGTALIGFRATQTSEGHFVTSLSPEGTLGLQWLLSDGSMDRLADMQLDFSPAGIDTDLRIEWEDQMLRCWAWESGDTRAESAQLAATIERRPFTQGRAVLGVVEGSAWFDRATVFASAVTPDSPILVSSFEEGDTKDWTPVLAGDGMQRAEGGDLVLEGPGINASVALGLGARADLSILTRFSLENATAALVTARARVNPYGGYVASLSADGLLQVLLARPNGSTTVLAEKLTAIDPKQGDVILYLRLSGDDLQAWAWPAEIPMPRLPLITAKDSGVTLTSGFAGLNALDGTVRFRYAEVAGVLDRPEIRRIRLLPSEPRFELTWPSQAGRVYEFEYSLDQENWVRSGLFSLGSADAETTSAIVAANILPEKRPFVLVRVVGQPNDERVPMEIRPLSPSPRVELTWDAVPARPYIIQYGDDLSEWQDWPNVLALGGFGELTSVVFPISPESRLRDATGIYYRLRSLPNS